MLLDGETLNSIHVLAENTKKRLGVISFYIEDLHYNLGVKLLNDRYGIQVRGGCSCAGTYGHYLLEVSQKYSKKLTCQISLGDLSEKPGWIRMSIHPVMTNKEVKYIVDAITDLAKHHKKWAKDYDYNCATNEFECQLDHTNEAEMVIGWFSEL